MMSLDAEGPHFCCLYKSKGTPKYPSSKQASECDFYRVNHELVSQVSEYLSSIKVAEVEG